jgi:hypothetical protein
MASPTNMLSPEFKTVDISGRDEYRPATGIDAQFVNKTYSSQFEYRSQISGAASRDRDNDDLHDNDDIYDSDEYPDNHGAQVSGIVFRDRDNDSFYDAGEGLANQTVTLRGVNGTFTTQTRASGDYQIAAPTGVYEVTISGPSISPRKSLVTLNGANLKVDANAALGVVATEGREVFVNTAGNDSFNGAGGIDAVLYDRARSSVTITIGANSSVTVTGSGSGTDTLINIERLQFSDGVIALDLQGCAGKAYRLYQAAFGRVPDKPGLSHNTKLMDEGLTLKDMSDAFTTSTEFARLYGANASNSTFVTALYNNVLGRAPDAGGEAFWINSLTTGRLDRGDVLMGFSESQENNGRVNPTIALAGISLDPIGFLA